MLYSEIIAVCSQIHTKYANTLCGQNVEFYSIKRDVTQSNHRVLNRNCVYTVLPRTPWRRCDYLKKILDRCLLGSEIHFSHARCFDKLMYFATIVQWKMAVSGSEKSSQGGLRGVDTWRGKIPRPCLNIPKIFWLSLRMNGRVSYFICFLSGVTETTGQCRSQWFVPITTLAHFETCDARTWQFMFGVSPAFDWCENSPLASLTRAEFNRGAGVVLTKVWFGNFKWRYNHHYRHTGVKVNGIKFTLQEATKVQRWSRCTGLFFL
jgi:hypothetical protein